MKRGRGLTAAALTLSFTITCSAQTYTQRGFLETQGTFYPEKGTNDSGHAVGEALFRYEGFYAPAKTFEFAGAFDWRIDTHRQDERELKISWQDRETRRPSGAVRRLSATYHNGPVTVELGKQFIRWGKTDIVTPTDRFAPRDFLNVVDTDFIGVTAARVNYEKGTNTIEAVWSPRFTPSRIPLANQRWAPGGLPAGFRLREAEVEWPGGPQTGIRWNHAGQIEYELSFYQGFNHLPSFELVNITPLPPPNQNVGTIDVRRFYPKMFMAGGDIAIPTRLFTIKAETAHFHSADARMDEYTLYVVQLERQSGEWFFVGGYAGEAVTSRGRAAAFAPDRGLTKTLLGRGSYTIDASRSVAFEAAVRQNLDGAWAKGEYSQSFGQHWRATLTLTLIRGHVDDFLGQYHKNSHALFAMKYSF